MEITCEHTESLTHQTFGGVERLEVTCQQSAPWGPCPLLGGLDHGVWGAHGRAEGQEKAQLMLILPNQEAQPIAHRRPSGIT